METRYDARCADCGYAANVLGEGECEHAAVTETRVCFSCREVVDVVSAFDRAAADYSAIRSHAWTQLDHCPRCQSLETRIWPASYPCPKCGVSMEVSSSVSYSSVN